MNGKPAASLDAPPPPTAFGRDPADVRKASDRLAQAIADGAPDPGHVFALAESGIPLDKVRLSTLLRASADDIDATAFVAKFTGTEYPNAPIAAELRRRAFLLASLADSVTRNRDATTSDFETVLLQIGEMFT